MPGCAGCQRVPVVSAAPTLLFSIESRYCAEWNGLALTVQRESSQWTLSVRDAVRNQTLYTAYRSGEQAAKLAAADYAITHLYGFQSHLSAALLATDLSWHPRW
jgi:hypothetical protein